MTRLIDEVLARLENVKKTRNGWMARCPCHEDDKNSLSIAEGEGERVLFYCFAGCHTPHILGAIDLEWSNLFQENQGLKKQHRHGGSWKQSPIVEMYDYTDAGENLLFQSCRTADKEFPLRRPDDKGGWEWNLRGVDPVLYHISEVLAAVVKGELIFGVEGEKDVERLRSNELTSTTNPMGAGKWKDSYSESLQGAHVVLIPDNDAPGREHVQKVATSLYGKAASIKIVELPGLVEKGADVSDWMDGGGTVDELLQLAEKTLPWTPSTPHSLDFTPAQPSFQALTFEQLMKRPPKQWLIEGILGKGDLGMLYGQPGSGKSFVAIDLILSAITGGLWADQFQISRSLSVAYCTSEGLGGLRGRFETAAASRALTGADLSQLRIFEDVPQLFDGSNPTSVDSFIACYKDQVGDALDLVVIDTLHGATYGANENNAGDAGVILQSAKKIQKELGCAVLVVHHSTKQGNSERGSSALKGAMDVQIEMVESGSNYRMLCRKQKDAQRFETLSFSLYPQGESCYVIWNGLAKDQDIQANATAQKIISVLERDPERTLSRSQLEEVTGKSKSQLHRLLSRLVEQEEVVQTEERRKGGLTFVYRVPPPRDGSKPSAPRVFQGGTVSGTVSGTVTKKEPPNGISSQKYVTDQLDEV